LQALHFPYYFSPFIVAQYLFYWFLSIFYAISHVKYKRNNLLFKNISQHFLSQILSFPDGKLPPQRIGRTWFNEYAGDEWRLGKIATRLTPKE
jgi:hypothetical protein